MKLCARGREGIVTMAAVAAVVFGAASAHAAIYTENLTGTVLGFNPISGFQPGSPDYVYTGEDETLTGWTTPAFPVVAGDEIDVTVTLDNPFTVPASTSWTGLVLDLLASSGGGGEENFVWTFFDGATPVAEITSLSTTSGGVSTFGILNPPNNGAFTFTSFTDVITVTTLNTLNVDLTGAFFEEFQATNVPEPATWSLMLAGFAGLGAALRARRRALAI
jgi:hypothetical protein